jgi:hypothetical protein
MNTVSNTWIPIPAEMMPYWNVIGTYVVWRVLKRWWGVNALDFALYGILCASIGYLSPPTFNPLNFVLTLVSVFCVWHFLAELFDILQLERLCYGKTDAGCQQEAAQADGDGRAYTGR